MCGCVADEKMNELLQNVGRAGEIRTRDLLHPKLEVAYLPSEVTDSPSAKTCVPVVSRVPEQGSVPNLVVSRPEVCAVT